MWSLTNGENTHRNMWPGARHEKGVESIKGQRDFYRPHSATPTIRIANSARSRFEILPSAEAVLRTNVRPSVLVPGSGPSELCPPAFEFEALVQLSPVGLTVMFHERNP